MAEENIIECEYFEDCKLNDCARKCPECKYDCEHFERFEEGKWLADEYYGLE